MNGRLVISLDFELHWGQFDHVRINRESIELFKRTRALIPLLLARFEQRDVRATWATVGALFAKDRNQLMGYMPHPRPEYEEQGYDARSSLFDKNLVGKDERHDPCHFGYSLLRRIRDTPGQEIGTHTFAHVFPLERGFKKEDLIADLKAAQAISEENLGMRLKSLVFPRNQYEEHFLPVLRESGIKTYRSNPAHWFWKPKPKKSDHIHRRFVRYTDDYIPLTSSQSSQLTKINGATDRRHDFLIGQSFSRFLRPPLHILDRMQIGEWLKIYRIKREMTSIARNGGIYHLWWHPHNMAVSSDQSFDIIDSILEHFVALRDQYGMESRTMFEIAEEAS